jgi:hypothetical protein
VRYPGTSPSTKNIPIIGIDENVLVKCCSARSADEMKKKNLAVLFGGRSVEHEISVITALQLMNVIDVTQYNIIPVYIAQTGRWYVGDNLLDKNFYRRLPNSLTEAQEVALLPAATRYVRSISTSSPFMVLLGRMVVFRGCWRWQTQLTLVVGCCLRLWG